MCVRYLHISLHHRKIISRYLFRENNTVINILATLFIVQRIVTLRSCPLTYVTLCDDYNQGILCPLISVIQLRKDYITIQYNLSIKKVIT